MSLELLRENIDAYAAKLGLELLAMPFNNHRGFASITATVAERHFGIQPAPKFDRTVLRHPPTYQDAIFSQIVSPDFPEELWERSIDVSRILLAQSRDKGFDFYNGHIARLAGLDISVEKGQSRELLLLKLEHTSFFTALGTNFSYGDPHLPEQFQLDDSLADTKFSRENLFSDRSISANPLGIHLILFNDKEIFYVQRAAVGISTGYYNSTVNGAVELQAEGDMRDSIPNNAIRECREELNIDLPPEDIIWLGCVSMKQTGQCAVIGTCRIPHNRLDLVRTTSCAIEAHEIEDKIGRFSNLSCEKAIRSIHRKFEIEFFKLSIGQYTFPVPRKISCPQRLSSVIAEKVLSLPAYWRGSPQKWHPIGAMALLLTLCHLIPPDVVNRAFSQLSKRGV